MAIEAGDKLVNLTDLKEVYDELNGVKINTEDVQAGTQATKTNHLGFYLNDNGDLCYDQ